MKDYAETMKVASSTKIATKHEFKKITGKDVVKAKISYNGGQMFLQYEKE